MRPSYTSSAGFTLIELMVALTVLSILLGVGVPAMGDMIRKNRLSEQANAVVGALNYARGETATRGIPISVCAATDATQTACSDDAANWRNGWIVFTDRTGTPGVIDGTDEILQVRAAVAAGFSLTTTTSFVRFGVGAQPTTALTFTVRPVDTSDCASTGRRQIVVLNTGRINTSKSTCQ